MNYRIIKKPLGYVVEVEKTKWHGKKYWTHFISVAGIENQPWHHETYEFAEMNLLDKIKWDTIDNSKFWSHFIKEINNKEIKTNKMKNDYNRDYFLLGVVLGSAIGTIMIMAIEIYLR